MKAPRLVRWWTLAQVYYASRAWSRLYLGLPVLLLMLVVLLTVVLFHYRPPSYQERYLRLAQRALREENFNAAHFYYQRLIRDDPKRPDYQFGFAIALNKMGHLANAIAIIERLAPLNEPGYLPAQLVMADFESLRNPLTAEDLQRAERHLLRAYEADPKHVEVNAKLGEFYLRTNRATLAEDHLKIAAEKNESVTLALARLQQRLQRPPNTGGWAVRAADFYKRKANLHPDDAEARIAWAEATVYAGNMREGLEILKEGWDNKPLPIYRVPLGRAYVTAIYVSSRAPDVPLVDQIELLEGGLRFDPTHPVCSQFLATLIRPKDKRPGDIAAAIGKVRETHPNWISVRTYLWADALSRKQPEEAASHFKMACDNCSEMAIVANNAAFFMARDNKANWPMALEMMNSVVARWPEEKRYRDTRGGLYVKLERWREASADLEIALPAMKENADLHKALSEAYSHLNRPAEAAEHAAEATRLRELAEKAAAKGVK